MSCVCSGVALWPVKLLIRPRLIVCNDKRDELFITVHMCLMFSSLFNIAAVVLSKTNFEFSVLAWLVFSGKSCFRKCLYADILWLKNNVVFLRYM